MVGINLTVDGGNFIIGKEFIPAAAPDVVVARVHGNTRGINSRVVPKKWRIERLIGDLPDFSTKLGKDDNTEKTVFEDDGVESAKGPIRSDEKFWHRQNSL
jgi:hypothetical protein